MPSVAFIKKFPSDNWSYEAVIKGAIEKFRSFEATLFDHIEQQIYLGKFDLIVDFLNWGRFYKKQKQLLGLAFLKVMTAALCLQAKFLQNQKIP